MKAVRSDTSEAQLAEQRRWMVEHHFRRRGIRDERVLTVMSRVPRHTFVPEELMRQAYSDHPLPIGEGQIEFEPIFKELKERSYDKKFLMMCKDSDRFLEEKDNDFSNPFLKIFRYNAPFDR